MDLLRVATLSIAVGPHLHCYNGRSLCVDAQLSSDDLRRLEGALYMGGCAKLSWHRGAIAE